MPDQSDKEKPVRKLRESWQPASNAGGADPDNPPKNNPPPEREFGVRIIPPDTALQKRHGIPRKREDQETAAMSPAWDSSGARPDNPPKGSSQNDESSTTERGADSE